MSKLISKKVQGLPTSSIRIIMEKARKISDVIRLEIGEPDFDTPEHIKRAAETALKEGFTHYTPFAGIDELRERLAEKFKVENGIDASPSQVVVTPGACSALFCSIFSTINAGDEMLLPDPGWPHYEACVKVAGGIPQYYPLCEKNGFRVDIQDLERRINKKTRAILINSPSNPTGAVFSRKDLEAIAGLAIEKDLMIFSDEVYEKIIYDGLEHVSIASLPGMNDRTVTINAFSKTYAMTGWRVGYAVTREDIAAQMAKLVLYTSTCANSLAQKAALAALEGPQDCVNKMISEYKSRRDFLIRHLNEIEGISCMMPHGAFYAFPNIMRLGMSSFECVMWLLEKARISTVPGNGFGANGEGYIRISYATSIAKLDEAIKRIELAIKKSIARTICPPNLSKTAH